MNHVRLDPTLARGFWEGDVEANALVAFVVANAERRSSDSAPAEPQAASYVIPLQEATTSTDRTLVFEIDTVDPDTEERHSFRTNDESFWRRMLVELRERGWSAEPALTVLLDVQGGPRGYATHSPHIHAA